MRLGAAYALLLRAYPAGRRRRELAETLIDAGRRRPGPGEAVNLLRHGLRARLGRPAGRGVVVMAFMVATVAGFGGAAVAARAAWEFAPAFPSGAALHEITETVYPGLGATGETPRTLFDDVSEPSWADVVAHGHNEDFGFAGLRFGPHDDATVPGDNRAWTERARARLEASGWRVTDVVTIPDSTEIRLFATRGELALELDTSTNVADLPAGSFATWASLQRLTPGFVDAAAIAALLVAGLLGWLAAGWASRRAERSGPAAETLVLWPAVAAMVLLFPQALVGALALLAEPFQSGPPLEPFWSLSVTWLHGLVLLGVPLLAVPMVAAAFARRRETLVEA
ncbi:hypothetical protein ACQPZJ_18275 [Actinoplanes sp. CA-054009]